MPIENRRNPKFSVRRLELKIFSDYLTIELIDFFKSRGQQLLFM